MRFGGGELGSASADALVEDALSSIFLMRLSSSTPYTMSCGKISEIGGIVGLFVLNLVGVSVGSPVRDSVGSSVGPSVGSRDGSSD